MYARRTATRRRISTSGSGASSTRRSKIVSPQGRPRGFRLDDQNRRRSVGRGCRRLQPRPRRAPRGIDRPVRPWRWYTPRPSRPHRVLEHHVGLHGKSVADDVSGFRNCQFDRYAPRRGRCASTIATCRTSRIGSAATRPARVSGALLPRAHQVESELAVRGSAIACVATAPTPASAHVTTEPAAK